jgi:hypothetical protein
MPLGVDQILQQNTGSFHATSGTVTLPAATTAGSTIILSAALTGDGTTLRGFSTPTGGAGTWGTYIGGAGTSQSLPVLFAQRTVAAGETSWTLPITGGATDIVWHVMEVMGVSQPPAVRFSMSSVGTNNPAAPVSSLTSPSATTDTFDTMVLAVYAATDLTQASAPVVSGYTNGFDELAQASVVGSSSATTLAIGIISKLDLEPFTTSASVSPNSYMQMGVTGFVPADVRGAPEYSLIFGAEMGTANGLAVGSAAALTVGTAPVDAITGSPAISSAFARSGSYSRLLSSTAAAEAIMFTNNVGGNTGLLPDTSGRAATFRDCVYFDTTLPSVDVPLWSFEAGSLANGAVVTYRTASQKIGVKVGTGTEVLSDATVSVNKWIGVDLRWDPRSTVHTVDWQVDYDSLDATVAPVAQTSVSQTGMTAGQLTTLRNGWTTAITATAYFDDLVYSQEWEAYPIGDVRIVPLHVDQTGTPTISGTATNFQTFASNGTGTAWNAATARAALNDIPPVIGASSNGVMQVTAAAFDYVEIPMETYDCAGAAVPCAPRAVRWYMAGWAASTSAATCGFQNFDGTNFLVQTDTADHGFDSTTAVWITAMQRQGPSLFYPFTQAKVDGLSMRFGFSNDATPDVGIHCVLAELAVQPAVTASAASAATDSGTAYLYVRNDPKTQAVISLLATTPPGTQGVTLTYALAGVDQTPIYVPPNTTFEHAIGAASIREVTSYGMILDPTG